MRNGGVKMKMCLISFMSQTAAYRFKNKAKENGFKVDIIQTPKEISYGGCTYGARCNCEDIAGLLVLCKRNNIGYSRVFREELFENGKKSYRQIN